MSKLLVRSAALVATISFSASIMALGFQAKLGDPIPKFSVTSMTGRQVFFKDMATGGPVFIYFIRDGDTVSQQMTSYVNKIIHAYGGVRSTWYGIVNAREDRARAYQAETEPAFRLTRDESLGATKMFGVSSAPTVLEYDGHGMLINAWKGLSAVNLKGINMAYASGCHKPMQDVDFSQAPATAKYGIDYNVATSAGGTGH
jgi:hypothetical protein